MSLTRILLLIYTAIRILIFVVVGIAVPAAGISAINHSQSDQLTQPYHEDMYMGIGIVALVVGIAVAWACLVHVVHIYRDYNAD